MIQPKIKFVFDRKKKASKTHKGAIELRITYDRTQKFMSMGISVFPGEWNDARQEVRGILEAPEINSNLATTKQRVYNIITEMSKTGEYDIQAIPALLKGKSVDITFLDYIVRRIEKRNVRENTKKAHSVFYNKLHEYGKIRLFSDINKRNIMAFDEWLHAYTWEEIDQYRRKKIRRYSQASIGSFHKNLKAFIADAIIDGYLKENPYTAARIKIDKGATRIDKFLTPEEVEKIKNATMPTKSLSEARDLFIFAAATGLSFSDLMTFNPKLIRSVDGLRMYSNERVKTTQPFSCVITDDAQAILDKYDGYLPKMPNQKYNIKLKLVADAAGVNKPITSHYARHTAAMLWINQGIPLTIIAKCLGHSAISTTIKNYAEVLDKSIAEAFKKKESGH